MEEAVSKCNGVYFHRDHLSPMEMDLVPLLTQECDRVKVEKYFAAQSSFGLVVNINSHLSSKLELAVNDYT